METTTESSESPVFGAMIGLLTGRGVDSAALQSLNSHTVPSARHALWEGADDDELQDIFPARH